MRITVLIALIGQELENLGHALHKTGSFVAGLKKKLRFILYFFNEALLKISSGIAALN
jgi:hypothetical protein